MKKVLAIAGLAVKAAIRSRLFLVLGAILLVVVIGLPATIKGDGTLKGQIALLIYYSLSLSSIVLGSATVWLSCWSIAREVEEKHIQMLVVKPVRRSQIWLGKWLGMLFINTVLLAVAAAVTLAAVAIKMSSDTNDPAEVAEVHETILSCRAKILPVQDDIETEVHQYMNAMIARGDIAEDAEHDDAFSKARKVVLARNSVVRPGASKTWTIKLDGATDADSVVALRYHLSRNARQRNPVSGRWVVGTENNPEAYTKEIDNYLFGSFILDVPAEILAGSKTATVTFFNADKDKSHLAVFRRENDLEMLVEKGSFTANYTRSVLILLCQLALIAALGLAVSALFTFPVASFTVISLLVLSIMSFYFRSTYETDTGHECHEHNHGVTEVKPFKQYSEQAVLVLAYMISPAMQFQPLGRLTDGLQVSWKETGGAVLILLFAYPGVFALLGAWFLNKRELAL